MKKIVKTLMPAMYLMVIAFSAASCNKTQAAPATAAVAPGQPVDLTYAAEKSLPAVVYIKSVTNSKVVSSDVVRDRATVVAASVRCKLRSVQLPVRVSSSQLTVIL